MILDRSTQKMLARAGPILDRLPDGTPLAFVEVGVNRGQLGEHLLQERPQLTWHGVDPWWDATAHASAAYFATRDGHAWQSPEASALTYRETLSRVERFRDRASVIRMASLEAAYSFQLESMDAVFLDAAHDYDSVQADIAAWWPIVKAGGWLGGDDYGHQDRRFDFSGVDRAVCEFGERAGGLPVELDRRDAGGVPMGACWFVRKP